MHPQLKEILKRQGYYIIGEHSGVKTCYWTKEFLLNRRLCYKGTFYGIMSHRCVQMSPSVDVCDFMCRHCWRYQGFTEVKFEDEGDDPEYVAEESIKAHRHLLSGFKSHPKVPKEIFEEAMRPKHAAISLTGEPALYPRLSELIKAYHRRGMSTFLVTNGSVPERLEALEEEPTQLYISLTAPNEELHMKLNRPRIRRSWERILRSLEIMSSLRARRVIRITAIKGHNMSEGLVREFARLLEVANPDFIEVKAYMYMGYSRYRLGPENMPKYEEVRDFALKIGREIGYVLEDERPDSRVALLMKERRERRRVPRFLPPVKRSHFLRHFYS